jgi:diadenosine tetraphosphate (Ap4A) HIT family hydrolase
MYNENNVFYKILHSKLSAQVIYENDAALSFHDIHPQKKVHALVISKGLYSNFSDFVAGASPQEMKGFFDAVAKVAEILGVSRTGYRILSNIGSDSGQEVPHFHVHIIGGEKLSTSF